MSFLIIERHYRTNSMDTLKIFCSYASEDRGLMERFRAHSRVLERLNVSIWYADNVSPGTEWERERDSQLTAAKLVLFLVSVDFISSREHRDKEILPAMARYNAGKTRVIPIILRPVDWRETSFGKLSPLPTGGKAVTDSSWRRQDQAFFNIVTGIKRAIKDITVVPVLRDGVGPTSRDASTQLAQIIQNFKVLREQIASFALLKGPKDFSITGCESQYNKLYGDTMLFLATYLPERVSANADGFVETVYRQTAGRLRTENLFDSLTVFVARSFIPPLAQLERLGMQIDACVATLETYQQRYFT